VYCMPAGTYKLVNSTEFNFLEVYNDEILARTNSGEMMVLNQFGKKVRSTLQKEEQLGQLRTGRNSIQMPLILADEFVKEILPLQAGNYLIVSSKGLFSMEAKSTKDLRDKLAKGIGRKAIL